MTNNIKIVILVIGLAVCLLVLFFISRDIIATTQIETHLHNWRIITLLKSSVKIIF